MPTPLDYITGGTSLLGGLAQIGSIVQNQSNFKRELEQRQRFFNQSMQNTWDMWNATNEYNSPANQAALMKAAGLNPDLQDINFQGASASPLPDPQSQFVQRPNISQQVAQAIPSVLDLLQRFQNLRIQSADVDASAVQSITSMDSMIEQIIGSQFSKQEVQEQYEALKSGVPNKLSPIGLKIDRKSYPQLTRRQLKSYNARYQALWNDPNFLKGMMKHYDDMGNYIMEENRRQSNPVYEDIYGSAVEALGIFMDLAYNYDISAYRSAISESKATKEYYDNYDAKGAADTDNVMNRSKKEAAELLQGRNAPYRDLMKGIEDAVEEMRSSGTIGGKIGAVVLQILAGLVLNPAISVLQNPVGAASSFGSAAVGARAIAPLVAH